MEHLRAQERQMRIEQQIMQDLMVAQWPVGKSVMVLLSCTQKIPTRGTVISHNKNCLRVRLDTKHRHIRDVHFNNVI